MTAQLKLLPVGDRALLVEFGNEISKTINAQIRKAAAAFETLPGLVELVPTYRSILINYDPVVTDYRTLSALIEAMDFSVEEDDDAMVTLITIPVVYGGEYGPDLPFVAEHAGLSEDDVVRIHAQTDYLVYMLGFMPGFTYLGGLDERIATPRLQSPRLKIPAGSVGIAGSQTGMYPSESPGGWQLIGRTPLDLYVPDREPPVFVNAGDYIRYVPIAEDEFQSIRAAVEAGTYTISIEHVKVGDLNG
ncbi:MAG: 5-oxoprolinase subunit PxpB [Peptoniphilaceae bacterium]|nr:5-oxoprolinase subunit PxpB [Peptoniphilaceae bacterium]MDY6085361.1 5-oxoprolinase subunit PxpB [Peptoniphilaceae bacterium]